MPDAEADAAIDDIVRVSRERNQELTVTGALLFTRHRFAQFLEGPEAGVNALQESILRDKRHHLITTACWDMRNARLFIGWSLVYSGASQYMASFLNQVDLGAEAPPYQVCAELTYLFQEFAQIEGSDLDRPVSESDWR